MAGDQMMTYDNLFTIRNDNSHVVAISSVGNEISVWSLRDGGETVKIRTLKGVMQPKDVRMVGRYRALVLCNRELKVYNLDTGKLESKLKGVMNQKMPFYGLHDDNNAIALSRNRMTVNIMNLSSGDLVTTFKVGEDRFLNSLLVSANGKICVCGDETQKPFPLLVWDLNARKLLYDLRFNHHEFITRLSAISDDAHYVVSVAKELNTSAPNFIVVYDLQSGMLFKKWKPASNSTAIAISSQSGLVVNCTEDCDLIVWDLATGDKRHTLKGHTSVVDKIQLSEAGKRCLSYDTTRKDRIIRVWDLESGTCIKEVLPEKDISCCLLTIDGTRIVHGMLESSQLVTSELSTQAEIKRSEPYGETSNEGKVFDLSKEG